MTDCTFDPKTVCGGMFHCPECGDMQLAGSDHLLSIDEIIEEHDRGPVPCADAQIKPGSCPICPPPEEMTNE